MEPLVFTMSYDDDTVSSVIYPAAALDDDDFEEATPIMRTHTIFRQPDFRPMCLGERLAANQRSTELIEEAYVLLKMTNTFATHTFTRQHLCQQAAAYVRKKSRWTFLHQAMWWNNTVATVALLEWGANWGAATVDGQTAADIGVSRNANAALHVLSSFIARNSTPIQSPRTVKMPNTPVKGQGPHINGGIPL
jgi:hypothetical protein